jgi:predicted nuclease of predicted toxin-antitoxin system
MKIWVNAQLSPAIADWIAQTFSVEAITVRDLKLRDATDQEIFAAARTAGAIVLTKDSDFVDMVNAEGAPPQVIWLTCGNTSNTRLREILSKTLSQALAMLTSGEIVVEIKDI